MSTTTLSPIGEKQTIRKNQWILYRTGTGRQVKTPVHSIEVCQDKDSIKTGVEIEYMNYPSSDGKRYLIWLGTGKLSWCEEAQIIEVKDDFLQYHIYGMSRPAGYATCPEGFLFESWKDEEGLEDVNPDFLKMAKEYYYQLVAYPRQLTDEACKSYEMRPISENTHHVHVGDWVQRQGGSAKYPAIVLRYLLNWNVEVETRTARGNFKNTYQENELELIPTSDETAIVAAQKEPGNRELPKTDKIIYLPATMEKSIVPIQKPRGNYRLPQTDPIIYLTANTEKAIVPYENSLRKLSQIEIEPESPQKVVSDNIPSEREYDPIDRFALSLGYSKQEVNTIHLFAELGMEHIWMTMNSVFACVEIVEARIDELVAEYYDNDRDLAARIFGSFMYCKSELPLSTHLMAKHTEEMLARVEDDCVSNDLSDAEVLYMLVDVSQENGMNEAGFALYLLLLRELFPSMAQKHHGNQIGKYIISDGSNRARINKIAKDYGYEHQPIRPRLPTGQRLESIIGEAAYEAYQMACPA